MTLRALTGREALAYWPLVERGLAEWSGTSDAEVDGVRLVGMDGIVRDGLARGVLELLLLKANDLEKPEAAALDDLNAQGRRVSENDGVAFRCWRRSREQGGDALCSFPFVHDNNHILAYDVVSTVGRWLMGYQVWVRPELRGWGLLAVYFDAALALAAARGLAGFLFVSTLPWWRKKAPGLGFRVAWTLAQNSGPEAVAYFREVN